MEWESWIRESERQSLVICRSLETSRQRGSEQRDTDSVAGTGRSPMRSGHRVPRYEGQRGREQLKLRLSNPDRLPPTLKSLPPLTQPDFAINQPYNNVTQDFGFR